MSVEQVCLVVVIHLLVGVFLARLGKRHPSVSGSLVVIAMILMGFVLIWSSLTP